MMRALAVLVATLVPAFAPVITARAQQPIAPLAVTEIAPGVFVHIGAIALMNRDNEGAIANVGFILGSEAVAVIDTGGSAREGDRLLAAIRLRTAKPIRYVVNTHMHPDHVFGNGAFVDEHPTFVGHGKLPRALAAHAQYYTDSFRRILGDELMAGVAVIPPTQLVDGELRLDLGARALVVKAWPTAHTDNDLTVLDESSHVLFAGDLVVVQHIPVLDGSIRGWLAVMQEMAHIPAALMAPGHGPVMADWPRPLEDQRRYLERLMGDVRASIAGGASIATAVQTAAQTERDRWALFDEYNARNATAAFAELEWE
jgi:quinoprotein relay system zinc metallohydrolase 2